ncbi:MAG: MFS transporter [Candidatus Sumerlaeaceae bacterium]|nr:MFS transporter [Candidatus Sumerlaeaceae bacterium]
MNCLPPASAPQESATAMEGDQQRHSPAEIGRIWKTVSWAGLLGTIYGIICMTGAPRVKFLTDLKATAFDFGLIAGLCSFAIAFQAVGSLLNSHLRRRKVPWMIITIAHRLLFAGVLVAAFVLPQGHTQMAVIISVIFVHDALAQTSVPMWLSWMTDLIPERAMGRYWARRQRFITILSIGAMLAIAFYFNWYEKAGQVQLGFLILGTIGIVLGVTDILLFVAVPEPSRSDVKGAGVLHSLAEPLCDRNYRPFLVYMSYWHFAIFVSAPFFGLFMIENLGYSVMTYQLLNVVGAVGVVLTSNFWGVLCDLCGYRPVLVVLSLGKAITPLAFMLAPKYDPVGIPFLVIMFFLDGICNSGCALATQGAMLKFGPRHNRAAYVAAANLLAVGIAAGISPMLAGPMIDAVNKRVQIDVGWYSLNGFHLAFFLSFLLRLGSIYLAAKIHEPGCLSVGAMWAQVRARNSLRTIGMVNRLHATSRETQRLRIIDGLTELRHPLAIGELISALEDESRRVRASAADALGWIGTSDATRPLARALSDSGSGIQPKAALALGRIGGMESLKALLANLVHEDPAALGETIDALGELGDGAAIVPLICLFHETNNEALRNRIATALGRLSSMNSVDEVMDALGDERKFTRPAPAMG